MKNVEKMNDNALSRSIHQMKQMMDKYRFDDEVLVEFKKLNALLGQAREEEAQLAKDKDTYYNYFISAPYGIFICNKSGKYLNVNDIAASQVGYTKRELLSMSINDLAVPIPDEQGVEHFNTLLKDGSSNGEVLVKRKDGSKFFMSIKAVKISDNSFMGITADVDRQKATEQALNESEIKNRALTEVTYEAIFITHEGYCIECNPSASRMFGYTYDEFIGEFSTFVAAPESVETIKTNALAGIEIPYEAMAMRKDGSKFWAEIRGKNYNYNDQKVRVISIRNISDRKKYEEALKKTIKELRESEERNRTLSDATHEGIVFSEKGYFVECNQATCTMFGYEHDEFIGMLGTEVIAPESRDMVIKNMLSGYGKPYEAMAIRKDGSTFIAEFEGKAYNYKGKSVRLTIIRDITQRKKDEEQLHQAANIFENILSGIHLYQLEDINDDRSLRLVAANPAATAITGLELKDIIGKTIDENFPESRKIGLPEKYAEVVRSQKPQTFEAFDYRDKRIGHLMLSLKAFPLPNNFVATSFESISKLKRTEKELKVRNTELNNFVYKVSHDLRAPLASIKGLLHLAKHENGPDEYLIRIEESIQKLDDFIRNVLSHSRNLNTTPIVDDIDFHLLIDQCFSELSYLPGIKRMKKEIDISGNHFCNDSVRIFEIFRNMISNAIKYQDLKKIRSFIGIKAVVDEKQVQIVIEDNGIGIEEKHLKDIFSMFYRASEKSDGSGIGLYIVNQAVKKLNGKIHVESKLESGTKFTIELPNLSV